MGRSIGVSVRVVVVRVSVSMAMVMYMVVVVLRLLCWPAHLALDDECVEASDSALEDRLDLRYKCFWRHLRLDKRRNERACHAPVDLACAARRGERR